MNATYTFKLSTGKEVETDVVFTMQESGIGGYEYWGSRGHHSAVTVEDVTLSYSDEDLTKEEMEEMKCIDNDIFGQDNFMNFLHDQYEAQQ